MECAREQDARDGVFWKGFLGLKLLSMIPWDATLNEMVLFGLDFICL